MLGRNDVQSATNELVVKSIFYTIQGEGPLAGYPAIFVRMAGCNLRCSWCDTDFDGGVLYSSTELFCEVVRLKSEYPAQVVVFTGGEPVLRPIENVIVLLLDMGMTVQVETAGAAKITKERHDRLFNLTHRNPRQLVWVCSPKTPRLRLKEIEDYTNWKYVLTAGEEVDEYDLPLYSVPQGCTALNTGTRLYKPDFLYTERDRGRIFVQPCDVGNPNKNLENIKYTAAIAMRHGYRLSLQMHKIAGLE